ncbi:MAG: hypothetical protein JW861_11195 [Bacteroidales bacterium]|nr:hypothetical protein [Bacteroidales bacterium]
MDCVVAYIDLLAFSDYIRKDLNTALRMYGTYTDILEDKLEKRHLRDRYSISSNTFSSQCMRGVLVDEFRYFLPFSDSIFLVGDNADFFIEQLANFLIDCYLSNSYVYQNPHNHQDPIEFEGIKVTKGKDSTLQQEPYKYFDPPILFRGGASFGETKIINSISVENSSKKETSNIAGRAILEAISLEQNIKGPKLHLTLSLFNALSVDFKNRYLKKLNSGICEVLWPLFYFIDANGDFDQRFAEFFNSAVIFWKAYNHEPYGLHYYEFMKIIVHSALRYFDIEDIREGKEFITERLNSVGLQMKERNFIDTYYDSINSCS